MRFHIASIMLIVTAFIFFVMFATSSYIMTTIKVGVDPFDDDLGSTYDYEMNLIPTAFAVIGAIFLVVGIISVFVLESLSDEPEMYWRE